MCNRNFFIMIMFISLSLSQHSVIVNDIHVIIIAPLNAALYMFLLLYISLFIWLQLTNHYFSSFISSDFETEPACLLWCHVELQCQRTFATIRQRGTRRGIHVVSMAFNGISVINLHIIIYIIVNISQQRSTKDKVETSILTKSLGTNQ